MIRIFQLWLACLFGHSLENVAGTVREAPHALSRRGRLGLLVAARCFPGRPTPWYAQRRGEAATAGRRFMIIIIAWSACSSTGSEPTEGAVLR